VGKAYGPERAARAARLTVLRAATVLVGLLLALTVSGMLTMRVPFGRALYLSVVTMTTLGDTGLTVHSGAQEIWVSVAVISGIVIGVAAIASLTGFGWVEYFQVVRRERMLKRLQGHVIVAGGGRVGRRAAHELRAARRAVLVIERDPALASELEAEEISCLHGDATDRAVLERAGLAQADGLIAALPDDAANLYVVSLARDLRPGLPIAARAAELRAAELLQRAGATRVVLPEISAGRNLAAFLSRPTMVELLEDGSVEEIRVTPSSPICGKTIAAVAAEGFSGTVAAVKRQGRFLPGIGGETAIMEDDILLLVGDPERLARELDRLIG
jgi:voltage-gated potassium channel